MARWRLYLGRSLLDEFSFDKGPVRIGRQADSDIVLEHQAVSRRHAVLNVQDGIWTVQIEDGKNGLFVNGQFTTRRELQNGDRIEIGRHVIHFIETPRAVSLEENTPIGQSPLKPPTNLEGLNSDLPRMERSLDQKTVTMSLDELKRMHLRNKNQMEAHLSWFVDNEKKIFPLKNQETVLGKGEQCDIKLTGGLPGIKRFVAIYRKGEQYYLEPLSRLIPVKVEGQLVKEPVRLMDGEKFQIFAQTLQFHEPM